MKTNSIRHHVTRYAKAFMPARVLQSQLHQRTYRQFAEKTGLVYFGYVDQHSDEHRLVRGFTVAATHRDAHYCIGSFKGYDLTVVERTDVLRFPGKPARHEDWIIMAFDLHTSVDLPHIVVGLHTHSETFYAQLFTKFAHLNKTPMGTFLHSHPKFIQKYAVYTEPARVLESEHLFTVEITQTMAEAFGGLTIEISDGCLYVYAWHQRPSMALLTAMLQKGLWLAAALDDRSNAANLHQD